MAENIEKVLKNAINVLEDVLPKKTYLYFPLLFSTLFWLVKRRKSWKEKVTAWKVWAEPGRIRIKPDAFVLFFFDFHEKLEAEFHQELEIKNMRALRKAFAALYPLIGLGDPFLCGLFHEELEGDNFREIIQVYSTRIHQAGEDLAPAKREKRVLEALGRWVLEAGGLLEEFLNDTKARDVLAEMIKGILEERKNGHGEGI